MRGVISAFVLLALCASVFALPDLVVSDLSWSPLSPTPGTTVQLHVSATNIGGNYTGNTSATFTRIAVDGTVLANMLTEPLPPGQTFSFNYPYTVTATPNPHRIVITADVTNLLNESDNQNNNLTRFMNVTLPYCGDTSCNGNENCYTCPSDCGSCCGNGICEPQYGETNVTCPRDCLRCTPGWFCRDSSMRAYQNQYCEVSTFSPCSGGLCCKDGACYQDRTKICGKTIITEVQQTNLAMTSGPSLRGQPLFAVSMAVLMGLVIYLFIRTETEI